MSNDEQSFFGEEVSLSFSVRTSIVPPLARSSRHSPLSTHRPAHGFPLLPNSGPTPARGSVSRQLSRRATLLHPPPPPPTVASLSLSLSAGGAGCGPFTGRGLTGLGGRWYRPPRLLSVLPRSLPAVLPSSRHGESATDTTFSGFCSTYMYSFHGGGRHSAGRGREERVHG